MNIESIVEALMTLFGVALLIYFLAFLIVEIDTEQKCLELGWKEHKVSWNFQRYCSREENEFEITKPLKELLSN